ncbi:MAG TPA: shikimate kinase [Candidatus Deferrimicrobiaceae bacterium]
MSLPFSVILVGFMGAGKSAVGRSVARLTGSTFVDLDDRIENEAGITVSEIFRTLGECGFRELEKKLIRQAVSVPGHVIATGGGAFADPENRALLKGYAPVVYLEVAPETVLKRLGADDKRPLLQGGDRERKVRDLMTLRRAAYEEADITITTDDKTVREIAAQVVSSVRKARGDAQ